jgi:hypothetical protein
VEHLVGTIILSASLLVEHLGRPGRRMIDLKSIVKRSSAGERRAGLCTVRVYPYEAYNETLNSVSFGLTIEI